MQDKVAGPDGSALSEGLGPLVACPFCGRREGYKLAEGDTYRWWLVQCAACGAGVAECHSDRRTQAGTELPQTWMAAHEAWNDAGKYAHELRCALYEVDRLAGHDDAFTEWREKWAHLFSLPQCEGPNPNRKISPLTLSNSTANLTKPPPCDGRL